MIHNLKTITKYFNAVLKEGLEFHVRKDQGFKRGDIIVLQDCDAFGNVVSKRQISRKVTYVLKDAEKLGI